MKIKYSWIPFIPVAFISVFLRIYQVMFVQNGVDTGFLSSGAIWAIYTALVVLLCIFLVLFTATDKKTAPQYNISRNFFGGLFALIAGFLICFGGLFEFYGVVTGGTVTVMTILDGIMSIIGGIVFLLMGVSCVSGNNKIKDKKIVAILPVIWCGVRLIKVFMSYTTQAVHSIDMTNLFYIAFALLFLYNFALILTDLDGRNPVKACFLYGMPMIAITLVYSAVEIVTAVNSGAGVMAFSSDGSVAGMYGSIEMLQFLALALFMLFFLIELTSKAKSKDAVADTATDAEEIAEVMEEDSTVDEVEYETEKETEPVISNVDDSVKEELGEVNEVIKNLEYDDNNPEKADPRSDEYLSANNIDDDEDINASLDRINALISDISTEDK